MAETLTKDEIREFHERVASGEISGAGTRIEQVYHAAVGTLLDELEAMAALLKTPVGTCWDCKHWHHLACDFGPGGIPPCTDSPLKGEAKDD